MTTLTDLASRYRWELMLLIGIPVIEQTIWWLLPHILGNFNIAFEVWSLPALLRPFLNISLLLLVFFYFQVRGLRRAILSLVWTLAFVYEAVETATYLLLEVDYLEQWSAIEISRPGSTWHIGLDFLPPTMVLVWFARQASKISFSHALVLIGLFIPGYVSRMIMPTSSSRGLRTGRPPGTWVLLPSWSCSSRSGCCRGLMCPGRSMSRTSNAGSAVGTSLCSAPH